MKQIYSDFYLKLNLGNLKFMVPVGKKQELPFIPCIIQSFIDVRYLK